MRNFDRFPLLRWPNLKDLLLSIQNLKKKKKKTENFVFSLLLLYR